MKYAIMIVFSIITLIISYKYASLMQKSEQEVKDLHEETKLTVNQNIEDLKEFYEHVEPKKAPETKILDFLEERIIEIQDKLDTVCFAVQYSVERYREPRRKTKQRRR